MPLTVPHQQPERKSAVLNTLEVGFVERRRNGRQVDEPSVYGTGVWIGCRYASVARAILQRLDSSIPMPAEGEPKRIVAKSTIGSGSGEV